MTHHRHWLVLLALTGALCASELQISAPVAGDGFWQSLMLRLASTRQAFSAAVAAEGITYRQQGEAWVLSTHGVSGSRWRQRLVQAYQGGRRDRDGRIWWHFDGLAVRCDSTTVHIAPSPQAGAAVLRHQGSTTSPPADTASVMPFLRLVPRYAILYACAPAHNLPTALIPRSDWMQGLDPHQLVCWYAYLTEDGLAWSLLHRRNGATTAGATLEGIGDTFHVHTNGWTLHTGEAMHARMFRGQPGNLEPPLLDKAAVPADATWSVAVDMTRLSLLAQVRGEHHVRGGDLFRRLREVGILAAHGTPTSVQTHGKPGALVATLLALRFGELGIQGSDRWSQELTAWHRAHRHQEGWPRSTFEQLAARWGASIRFQTGATAAMDFSARSTPMILRRPDAGGTLILERSGNVDRLPTSAAWHQMADYRRWGNGISRDDWVWLRDEEP